MDITEITLERHRGDGSGDGVLVLRRDGHASFTASGHARLGTADSTTRGTIRLQDFEALGRLVVAQGFFQMDDVYQDPQLADGAWTTVAVSRAGHEKRVFRREDAGPPALRTIERAIDTARAGIGFAP